MDNERRAHCCIVLEGLRRQLTAQTPKMLTELFTDPLSSFT